MKKLLLPITLFYSYLVSGCSTGPNVLIIDPDIQTPAKVNYMNKHAKFSINDERKHQYLLTINEEGEAQKTQSSQQPLTKIIESTVVNEFTKQGIIFNDAANNLIDIKIDSALITVNQSTFSYEATTTITLRLIIDTKEQTLTQTFNNSSNTEGPLKADIPMLETNFNRQLNKVITDALNNEEIIAFIRRH